MINNVSGIHYAPINRTAFKQSPKVVEKEALAPIENDQFISSTAEKIQPPEIGVLRLATGFLTDEQIEGINKSKQLPPNAKFIMNGCGSYSISNNFFGIRVGTQTLPEGFEVRKNVIGQAIVLPKGSDGLLIT